MELEYIGPLVGRMVMPILYLFDILSDLLNIAFFLRLVVMEDLPSNIAVEQLYFESFDTARAELLDIGRVVLQPPLMIVMQLVCLVDIGKVVMQLVCLVDIGKVVMQLVSKMMVTKEDSILNIVVMLMGLFPIS